MLSRKSEQGVIPLTLLLAIIGVVILLAVASLLPLNSNLRDFFFKPFTHAASVTNLLSNGDFETDFTSWPINATFWTIDSSSPYQGAKSAQYKGANGGSVRRNFSGLTVGKTYKVSYWLKLNSQSNCTSANPSADCWGWTGARVVNFANLNFQVNPPAITKTNTNLGIWNKYAFQFTVNGPGTSGQLEIGPFAGSGYTWDFQVDDIKLFELPTTPISPTVAINANPLTVASITSPVTFSSTADDDDGSVNYYFWDFGDGGKSNLPNPQYKYSGNGIYTAKLKVYDDSGLSAEDQTSITVADPILPSLIISSPSSSILDSTTSQIAIAGNATAGNGKTISKVEYSTDRGLVGTASGTTSWNATVNFGNEGGVHRILVTVTTTTGEVASKTITVTYKPAGKIDISGGASGITQNSSQIELYDKFEASFNLTNGQFSNPYLPFETNLPDGMKESVEGKGVAVEATFTSPSGKTLKQPGFLYQPYQRVISTKQLIPSGTPQWKIRFSPTELGTWTYSLSATDASGTITVSDASKLKFTAIPQTNPNNHGFLQVSQKDKRYFEFSDGTPYVGIGPGPVIGDSFTTDTDMAKFASNSANLSRTWMSGDNISGSSWAPWAGGIDNVSNSPGTSLTTEQAYSDGVYSFTLPQQGPGARSSIFKDCSMFGFYNSQPSVKPNTNYRILLRLKTSGIMGTGGFTVRTDSPVWGNPGDTCSQYATTPVQIPYQKGTTDWHVVTTNWNSTNKTKFGYLLFTLENVTGGRVYVDEVSVREDLGNNTFGPEILARSKYNVQEYFSQEPSWNWDYGFDEFAKRGIYQKPVIEEKDDYSYNFISPYGYGFDKGGQIGKAASLKYQSYFWRYLIARYGYSRAVHSWEFANEQAPGSLWEAQNLAKYMDDVDPRKAMATTSFWCCISGAGNYYWQGNGIPNVDYADTHSYVGAGADNTTWLTNGLDPLTGVHTASDSAVFVAAHSLDALSKNAAGNKPIIMGEAGIGQGSLVAGNNDSDTTGVWWHQFLWPQINKGGMYFIYWYDQSIKNKNLSPLTSLFRLFLEGKTSDTVNTRIPLTNGNYQDIQLTLPNGTRGWGQKDIIQGGAHFWIYDSAYTWINPTAGANVSGKVVSFDQLPAKQYTVEFWDTWTGNVTKQTVNHSGGVMTLTIPTAITQKDVGVKIYPTVGYTSTIVTQTPPPSTPAPSASLKVGDIVVNQKVDIFDYNALLTDFGKKNDPVTPADLDNDNDVDIFDYNILLTNFGQ